MSLGSPSIKINPEYEALLPPLSTTEYEALKESIKNEGQHFPIIINSKRVILDGHNRFKINNELETKTKYTIIDFNNPLLEKKFVITVNLKRRHLNNFQKAELAYKLEPIEIELARQRRSEAGKIGRNIQLGVGSNEHPPIFKGKARDIAAKEAGLTPTTYHRAKKIIDKGSTELKQKAREGKVSVHYGYQSIVRQEKHKNPPQLPEGDFDVIYADPPWSYDIHTRGSPDGHYPVMTQNEICYLDLPIAENAILFLWATNPKLREALEVIKQWGFTYKTNIVWIKDKFGTGYYVRGQHELLLIAKAGNIPPPVEKNRPPSIIDAPIGEHSSKPEIVYEIIEKMYPNRKYLELFARNKREGWTSWGTEV